jgi:hypothetical protein
LAAVRTALADEIERGDVLHPVRLRERSAPRAAKDRGERDSDRAAVPT